MEGPLGGCGYGEAAAGAAREVEEVARYLAGHARQVQLRGQAAANLAHVALVTLHQQRVVCQESAGQDMISFRSEY
jgi:hypothetical protein